MTSSIVSLLTIVGLVCALQSVVASEVDHVKSWGDLSKAGSYFSQIETRVGIPLIHRDITVSYPEVSSNQNNLKRCAISVDENKINFRIQDFFTEGLPIESYTIKGIKYVESSEDSCAPKSEILKGGIDQKFATVKITSGRGCGLHSVVSFLVERPKETLEQEIKS